MSGHWLRLGLGTILQTECCVSPKHHADCISESEISSYIREITCCLYISQVLRLWLLVTLVLRLFFLLQMALNYLCFILGFIFVALSIFVRPCYANHTFLWSFTDSVRIHLPLSCGASANSPVHQIYVAHSVSAEFQSSHGMRKLENECPTSRHSQYHHVRVIWCPTLLSHGIRAWWVRYHYICWHGSLKSQLAG
jgi:hypothetical protein